MSSKSIEYYNKTLSEIVNSNMKSDTKIKILKLIQKEIDDVICIGGYFSEICNYVKINGKLSCSFKNCPYKTLSLKCDKLINEIGK